jgi:NAD(P)-dependent dehydrogenase (short-subunit alcohol dehydrogenase family)
LAVSLAARDATKLAALCEETGASASASCDASYPVTAPSGAPDVVIFNASARTRGPLVQLDPEDVETALRVSALAGFVVAQEAVRRMLPLGHTLPPCHGGNEGACREQKSPDSADEIGVALRTFIQELRQIRP